MISEELPKDKLPKGKGPDIGEIESVKATSPLYSAVGGEVVEANDGLNDKPETVNQDAFEGGWMIKVRAADMAPLDGLMDAGQYEAFMASEG